ncbi:MAG: transcriptional repressor [Prevotellaceae bacterium]|jgi:Fur family ferric uptake transcriptional regulator|nr:transcriptional repressor [Prevotellaceae bacterium]
MEGATNFRPCSQKTEEVFRQRDISPTAIRLLVARAMYEFEHAFTLANLEDKLDTVDKSTLSRTINLFHAKHLIHSIDDGSGSIKYSVCSDNCMCEIADLHPHFFCTKCRQTTCMDNSHIPQVELPENYHLSSVNFVLKGVCAQCSKGNSSE